MSSPAFSARTAWPRHANRLSEVIEAERARGELLDMTDSNPTRCGLMQPEWAALLGDARGAAYRPEPRGDVEARAAVVDYYARRGRELGVEQLVLTSSSSESYAWLFKLLCDPGDAVLAPRPSYPLFPYLAELESVELASYPLAHHDGWRIDMPELVAALEAAPRARAILAVHPANPTGSRLHPDDARQLGELAAERGLALIVDEVFLDYPHDGGHIESHAGTARACTFVLSGLSKVALLPQHKLGWIVASGPGSAEALARLEVVADSYLPVSTAVQLAAPTILRQVEPLQARLRERLAVNLRALDEAIAAAGRDSALRRLPSEGGWYALLQLPRTRSDDAWAEHLVRSGRVIVHPGQLFDMPVDGVMVLSLLLDEARFAEGAARLVAAAGV